METVFNIPGVRGDGSLDRRHGGGGQQTSVVLHCTLGMFFFCYLFTVFKQPKSG